jgi:hypothetical protein
MKKLTLSLLAGLLALAGAQAQAMDNAQLVRNIALASLAGEVQINNLINWKVGEYTNYNIEAMGMPLGTMKKYVASEQGNNIWLNQDMEGQMLGNHKVEVLMDRATGQVLEMKQDGKKAEVPNDPIEMISQDATQITVPAGTFEVIHVVAKSKQIKKLEVWANPRDIALDGGAQMTVDSGMFPMTLKLTSFGGR